MCDPLKIACVQEVSPRIQGAYYKDAGQENTTKESLGRKKGITDKETSHRASYFNHLWLSAPRM
jgi:hypothetical protein